MPGEMPDGPCALCGAALLLGASMAGGASGMGFFRAKGSLGFRVSGLGFRV